MFHPICGHIPSGLNLNKFSSSRLGENSQSVSNIVERRSSDIFMRAKQKMQDVSPNIHQIAVPSIQPENKVLSENTVLHLPIDIRKIPSSAFRMWELSERTLKKHEIILDLN